MHPAHNHKVHIIFTQFASFLKQIVIDEYRKLVNWPPRWTCCWEFNGGHGCGENRSASTAHNLGNSLEGFLQSPNFNMTSVLSHIRRVCTPLDRVGRGSRPRQLHPSHYGYLCPVETPEGPACGLIKAFAVGARVTLQPNPATMKAYRAAVKECLPPDASSDSHFVMLNGDILGHTDDPCETVNRIQQIVPPGAECILISPKYSLHQTATILCTIGVHFAV